MGERYDAAVLRDRLVTFTTSEGRSWFHQGHTVLLFRDEEAATEFLRSHPGLSNKGLHLRIMDGWEDLKGSLETFLANGARYVALDPPPGVGARCGAAGIESVVADVQRILDGWEDVCPHCGLRPMECRCT